MSENVFIHSEVTDITVLPHIPSSVQADTLFTFAGKIEYIIPSIKDACIYPRYCEEDVRYLNLDSLKKVYIPMKCFCDINLHKLSKHLGDYGAYGLAFSKEWGMRNGIQPVHYINSESELCKDFSDAFSHALALVDNSSEDEAFINMLKDYMLHDFMYFKPYEGMFRNRVKNKTELKCFMEECEWRYIPNLSRTDYPQIIRDNVSHLDDLNQAIMRVEGAPLKFDYSDLKYIIIKRDKDFNKIVKVINGIKADKNTKDKLISKIIIWESSKGDF